MSFKIIDVYVDFSSQMNSCLANKAVFFFFFLNGDYSLRLSNNQVTYSNVLHLWVEDLLQGPRRQNGKRKHSLSLCDVFQVLHSSISLSE